MRAFLLAATAATTIVWMPPRCADAATSPIGLWRCDLDARLGPARAGFDGYVGRGLATCRAPGGFEFETPVVARLETERPPRPRAGTVSLQAASRFAVLRDMEEIMDSFEPVRVGRSTDAPEESRVLFRGRDRGLLMELGLYGAGTQEIKSLVLAPDRRGTP